MDIPLVIIMLAFTAALIISGLFVVLVRGIRAEDQRKTPFNRPRNTAEHLTRSVLMYARRADPSQQPDSAPDSGRERRR